MVPQPGGGGMTAKVRKALRVLIQPENTAMMLHLPDLLLGRAEDTSLSPRERDSGAEAGAAAAAAAAGGAVDDYSRHRLLIGVAGVAAPARELPMTGSCAAIMPPATTVPTVLTAVSTASEAGMAKKSKNYLH